MSKPGTSSLAALKHHGRYDYVPIDARPQVRWPGDKRLAFYVALNVERFSFGEGLGHTPTALGPPPDTRNFGWRDYGLRVGIWRIFDLFDQLGWPLCHLFNASICESMPQIVERIRRRNDEVVGHGFSNSERQSDMDEATEAAMIKRATEVLTKAFGRRPTGWMGPWIAETPTTPDLLKEAGYSYVMDWPADDQPFWMKTRAGPLMSVPYPIEINDSPTMLSRAQSATDFTQMIRDQFEEMLELSERHSLVCGISLHTFVVGQPFRLRQLRQALNFIRSHPKYDQLWITTPGQICDYAARLPQGTIV
jgi:allantoinase